MDLPKFNDRVTEIFLPFLRLVPTVSMEFITNRIGQYNSLDESFMPYINEDLLSYFEKVIEHKCDVYTEGLKLFGDQIPQFRRLLTIHDLSKFSIKEAPHYATYFNGVDNTDETTTNFKIAWNHHKNVNPHHPEYWLSTNASGDVSPLPMPEIYVKEWITDLVAAGISYGDPFHTWWPKNKDSFLLHPVTLNTLNTLLKETNLI